MNGLLNWIDHLNTNETRIDNSSMRGPAILEEFPPVTRAHIALHWTYRHLHPIFDQQTSWWRHQMETFSALLALCAGNSPVPGEFPAEGQWRGALMFSLICTWINGSINNREAGGLRRHRTHYDVAVMIADFMSAPSQWETVLLCNDVSHWLGTSLESALQLYKSIQYRNLWFTLSWQSYSQQAKTV